VWEFGPPPVQEHGVLVHPDLLAGGEAAHLPAEHPKRDEFLVES
jgi:hypothetical protein